MDNSRCWRAVLVAALASLLCACAEDGSDGADGTAGTNGRNGTDGSSALIRNSTEPPGTNCPAGGSRIDTGQDANRNGALDADEISSTQFACNGTGVSLVETDVEPAGANCPNGGQRFSAGIDANGNGSLEATEVSSTGYACNGQNGGNGANATNDLMAVAQEPAGANCTNGGVKVTSGPDTNANGSLEPAEIAATQFICNGAAGSGGTNGLTARVLMTPEPIGANCANGGTRIDAGLDANSNGSLDTSEITATQYACNGSTLPMWTNVTGTTQQTEPNGAYIVSSDSTATLTLPLSADVGDFVRVTGAGLGGWKVVPNSGQSIVVDASRAAAPRLSLPNPTTQLVVGGVHAVRSSYDGSLSYYIYRDGFCCGGHSGKSTNYGADPDLSTGMSTTGFPIGLAVSYSGQRVVVVTDNRTIQTSSDAGLTWQERDTGRPWRGVASSADGQRLAAVTGTSGGVGGFVYTSTDAGVTWTPGTLARNWSGVLSSASGMRLFAYGSDGTFYSEDGGSTWTERSTPVGTRDVAAAADGIRLAAATGSEIWTSSDAGFHWALRHTVPFQEHVSISMSSSGMGLLATGGFTVLVQSLDGGVTWHDIAMEETPPPGNPSLWYAGHLSGDGQRIFAPIHTQFGGSMGRLLILGPTMVPIVRNSPFTSTGFVFGDKFESTTFQYLGNGEYVVTDSTGALIVR